MAAGSHSQSGNFAVRICQSGKRIIVISLPCVRKNVTGDGGVAGPAFKAVGWASIAVSVVALGVFVGRELRIRYKFRHRTPSELYAHAGDQMPEYGMGI